jgi:hypothetical protein
MSDTPTPAWDELSDADKAEVTRFLRTAEGEGFAYAAENYPPRWAEESPLSAVDSRSLRELYGVAYKALSPDEFWWLYEFAGERSA